MHEEVNDNSVIWPPFLLVTTYTVQLNLNLTLVFDYSLVLTDFVRVPDQ